MQIIISTTISLDWTYEKEVRFFTTKNNGTSLLYNPKSLQSIIMGSRVSKCKQEKAKQLVYQYNKKHQTKVEIFQATKSLSTYEMTINKIKIDGHYIKKIVFED